MTGRVEHDAGWAERIARLEDELHDLTRRLEDSERARRRSRRAGAGVLAVAALLIAGGAAQFANRVPRLEVVGPNNDVRASISVDPVNGSAGLEVFGLNGRRVIFLGTSAEGTPNLAIYDPSGQAIIRNILP